MNNLKSFDEFVNEASEIKNRNQDTINKYAEMGKTKFFDRGMFEKFTDVLECSEKDIIDFLNLIWDGNIDAEDIKGKTSMKDVLNRYHTQHHVSYMNKVENFVQECLQEDCDGDECYNSVMSKEELEDGGFAAKSDFVKAVEMRMVELIKEEIAGEETGEE